MNNEPERDPGGDPRFGEEADLAFERELNAALRPLRLPVGLAERIVTAGRAERVPPSHRPVGVFSLPARRWLGGAAIAAVLVSGVFATEDLRQNRLRERQRALATEQFEAATRITDRVLEHTREHLEQVGALPSD